MARLLTTPPKRAVLVAAVLGLGSGPARVLAQGTPSPATAATAGSGAPPEATAAGQAGATPAGADQAAAASKQEARDLSLPRPVDKPWQAFGEAQYRALLIRDTDPANDQRMYYRLQFNYEVVEDLILSARGGVVQRFVAEEGETGVRLEDASLGALYQQSVGLDGIGWDRELSLAHRLRVYLPTSFISQEQDLLFAAEWTSRARVRVTGQLFAGLRGLLQYNAHDYAEQAGLGGGMLPRWVAEALAFTEYSPIVSPEYGTLTVGADVYVNQTFVYPSRDPGDLPASDLPPGTLASNADSIVGAGTTDDFSSPNAGYDVYLLYQPPIEHVLLMASLEQLGSAQRYGETRVYLFHRDETEFALRLLLNY